MGRVTRHFTYQEQRRVTQLHALTCLHGEGRDLAGLDARDDFADAVGNLHAILVELALPQHAGEYRTPQGLLGRDNCGRGAFMRAGRNEMAQLQYIQAHNIASFRKSREQATGIREQKTLTGN